MSDGLTAFLTAIGLIFVIEGGLYALFPEAMRRSIARVLAQPSAADTHHRHERGPGRPPAGLAGQLAATGAVVTRKGHAT